MNETHAGTVCLCGRCGKPCRVADAHTEDARLLRKSLVPRGLCLECATTDWLKTTEPVCSLLENGGPDMLRLEHVREQFAAIMSVGKADARPDEIDWDQVIGNWYLPLTKPPGKKRGRRP